MRNLVHHNDDGLKICSTCNRTESDIVIFRKRRNQCIDCVNSVRRAGNKRKITVEKILLAENINYTQENYRKKYKKQWYKDNKNEISEENKIKYLNSRENRLLKA